MAPARRESRPLAFMRGTDEREQTRPLDLMALLESLIEDFGESGQGVRLEGAIEWPYLDLPWRVPVRGPAS